MKIHLMQAPFSAINSPYPATAYLTGFLRTKGYNVSQSDPGIEVIDRLLSAEGLDRLFNAIHEKYGVDAYQVSRSLSWFVRNFQDIKCAAPDLAGFLRGGLKHLEHRLNAETFLTPGPYSRDLLALPDTMTSLTDAGLTGEAIARAGFLLMDIFLTIKVVDPVFKIDRYGEQIARGPTFDQLQGLLNTNSFVDSFIDETGRDILNREKPDLVGLSAPFPGNIYGAFRLAKLIKQEFPSVRVVLGGGYVNTSLRDLQDVRVFDYFDFITYDDGERPLLNLIEHLSGNLPQESLCRTRLRVGGSVKLVNDAKQKDIPQKDTGVPTYRGLPWNKYINHVTSGAGLNWLSYRINTSQWNKLTLAHGCYWRRCTFCDVSLDYISRYEANPAATIVERMDQLYAENGIGTFHFVDEACPPVLLGQIARRLQELKRKYVWYGNIRFDKAFRPPIAQAMADAGCMAVTGGLEVASDRILQLMDKGTNLKQVFRVCKAFRDAGIYVHGYLIYGFPTQTVQEVIDSLEVVRQLFALGLLHSGAWHRFTVTSHSPIGKNPDKYGVILEKGEDTPHGPFDTYFVPHSDKDFVPYDQLTLGLRTAHRHYMQNQGLERPVESWFSRDLHVPPPTIPPDFVQSSLEETDEGRTASEDEVVSGAVRSEISEGQIA